ncbi:glutamate racemase [Arcobacter sp.]|uniref:glutamate racemase n=1 Tax=unclassified Arcobacter TaxID=2593671 RepID=UPI003AFF8FBB
MRVGVFDSGIGGLTVVKAITEVLKGAEIFYIADTKFAPYGEKSKEQILKHSFDIANYLVKTHNIDALVVACNTATSAAIKELREHFPNLIVIGTEPGIKPAISLSKNWKIGILATPATLKGEKYQLLVDKLSTSSSNITLHEQACPGLVQQIENGDIETEKTFEMLQNWLKPMREEGVDTIVLGCTHYPLVGNVIKKIMGENTNLIETGYAIANRLKDLSKNCGHFNDGVLKVNVYFTSEINETMISKILNSWNNGGKIVVRNINE